MTYGTLNLELSITLFYYPFVHVFCQCESLIDTSCRLFQHDDAEEGELYSDASDKEDTTAEENPLPSLPSKQTSNDANDMSKATERDASNITSKDSRSETFSKRLRESDASSEDCTDSSQSDYPSKKKIKRRKKMPSKKNTEKIKSSENESTDDEDSNKREKSSKVKRRGQDSSENSEEELLKKKRKIEEQLRLEMGQRDEADGRDTEKNPEEGRRYEEKNPEMKRRETKASDRKYRDDEIIGERYWGGRKSPETTKRSKTSDTYWNKYADELGIQIRDPHKSDKTSIPRHESEDKRASRGEKERRRGSSRGRDSKNSQDRSPPRSKDLDKPKEEAQLIKKPVVDPTQTRTGGAYIPPAKLKMMQASITDKNSAAFQRLAWEALKKSINGLVNKVNVSNIGIIVRELLKENIIRGRGILCRSLMQAQSFSQTYTHVYAALVAVINSKFPQVGELLLRRLVTQFKRGIKRSDKTICVSSCKFIAHLINQQVAHEVVALEIISFLFEKGQDLTDSTESGEKSRNNCVELAATFLKECGMKLKENSPRCMIQIMDSVKNIMNEGKLEDRIRYMLEALWSGAASNFKDNPAVEEKLDLVEEEDQITHIVELDSPLDTEDILNVFKHDPEFEAQEEKYKEIKESMLGGSSDESGSEGSGSDSDSEDSEENEEQTTTIIDATEGNMLAFRRTVYLTFKSSLTVDEAAHKILKGDIKPGWEVELCNMILDCCAQERTFVKFYAILAQRFCNINRTYQDNFLDIFSTAYDTCHRLESEKLRNVAKFFSHLFITDAIGWGAFSVVKLDEDNTTSSSRVFLKILFQVYGCHCIC